MIANQSTGQDRARAEHLVDRVLGVLFPGAVAEARRTTVRLIHQARMARRAGDLDGALATLSELELASAPRDLACWAYTEWLAAARQRYPLPNALLYRAGTGQAAVLVPGNEPGTLRVVTVLGLRWEPGRTLSRRCLRGLRPLHSRSQPQGGEPCPRE
jgi:hypothetical protein